MQADLVSPRKSVETTMSVVYPRMPFRGPASLAALSTWKSVSQSNLHKFRLHQYRADLVIGGWLLQTNCQVDDGDVRGGHPECHAWDGLGSTFVVALIYINVKTAVTWAGVYDYVRCCETFDCKIAVKSPCMQLLNCAPVSFPFSSGITLPTALAAPVEEGMMFCAAPRPYNTVL